MSNESGTSSCIYDISRNKKKAIRLDHFGKEEVGLLDLHAKNIIKEIIDYYRRTVIGDLTFSQKLSLLQY